MIFGHVGAVLYPRVIVGLLSLLRYCLLAVFALCLLFMVPNLDVCCICCLWLLFLPMHAAATCACCCCCLLLLKVTILCLLLAVIIGCCILLAALQLFCADCYLLFLLAVSHVSLTISPIPLLCYCPTPHYCHSLAAGLPRKKENELNKMEEVQMQRRIGGDQKFFSIEF
ncbi:putative cellulose synthase A catalytic subunit 10 [UDP-forming] [Bienertia sinuspersici]